MKLEMFENSRNRNIAPGISQADYVQACSNSESVQFIPTILSIPEIVPNDGTTTSVLPDIILIPGCVYITAPESSNYHRQCEIPHLLRPMCTVGDSDWLKSQNQGVDNNSKGEPTFSEVSWAEGYSQLVDFIPQLLGIVPLLLYSGATATVTSIFNGVLFITMLNGSQMIIEVLIGCSVAVQIVKGNLEIHLYVFKKRKPTEQQNFNQDHWVC